MAFAKKGYHVLLEKPMAVSVSHHRTVHSSHLDMDVNKHSAIFLL